MEDDEILLLNAALKARRMFEAELEENGFDAAYFPFEISVYYCDEKLEVEGLRMKLSMLGRDVLEVHGVKKHGKEEKEEERD